MVSPYSSITSQPQINTCFGLPPFCNQSPPSSPLPPPPSSPLPPPPSSPPIVHCTLHCVHVSLQDWSATSCTAVPPAILYCDARATVEAREVRKGGEGDEWLGGMRDGGDFGGGRVVVEENNRAVPYSDARATADVRPER
ncbi:unnamed protein product [Closterium sp. NIES-54]